MFLKTDPGRNLGEERWIPGKRSDHRIAPRGGAGESSNVLVYQRHPITCYISVRNPSGYKSIRFVEIPNALEIYTFSCSGIN